VDCSSAKWDFGCVDLLVRQMMNYFLFEGDNTSIR
jgi:hypothetical protein